VEDFNFLGYTSKVKQTVAVATDGHFNTNHFNVRHSTIVNQFYILSAIEARSCHAGMR
jgi:hypothetical protein